VLAGFEGGEASVKDDGLLETIETDEDVIEDLTGCLDLAFASIGRVRNAPQGG